MAERIINGMFFDVTANIPVQQQVAVGTVAGPSVIAWPSTIASTATFNNGGTPIALQGFARFAVGGVLNQAGTVSLQPYLDTAGSVPVGTPTSASVTASTPFAVVGSIGTASMAQSVKVTIINGGAAATLSSPVLVLQSS